MRTKCNLSAFLGLTLLLCGCNGEPHYWKGADIGWATEYESHGQKFYNRDGQEPECRPFQYKLGAFDSEGKPTVIMDGFLGR